MASEAGPRRLDVRDPGFAAAFDALAEPARAEDRAIDATVAAILDDVRRRGDAALIEYTEKLDHHAPTMATLRVGAAEIAGATRAVEGDLLDALRFAAERIRQFHDRQLPEREVRWTDAAGVSLGWRWTALDAVGLYVPGGSAAYPSSVLMNAIPAKVAGVRRLVVVVPTPGGKLNPLVLAAAELAGADEVYRVGGAQAVAALAYGTATIAAVDKIVGPGNAYVTSAKRQVFGTVGIDTIAGPSEILVIADRHNDPAWIAADLLSQAEHDELARAILITDDAGFADAVAASVETHLGTLGRAEVARASWTRFGGIVTVGDLLAEAPGLADRIAAEHVEIAVAEPEPLAARIRHAGALFLGRFTPEAIGDYVGGPDHVLPTSRAARYASGLGVLDFLKRTTLLGCTAQSLATLGPAAVALAGAEGLPAHALSVSIRLGSVR